jgi:phosphatidylserine decarboxylase
MIKFGSRTELYIPKERVEEIRIKLKDKVKGGETVIARTR